MNDDVWYSEILASEIELMSLLGFKSVYEAKNIRLSKEVIYNSRVVTFKDFLEIEKRKYIDSIYEQVNKNEITFDILVSLLRAITYFQGKVNFCKKYLIRTDEVEFVVSMSQELMTFAKTKFNDDDNEFSNLLDSLYTHFSRLASETSKTFINDTMNNMLYVLVYNHVPEYKAKKQTLKAYNYKGELKNG